MLCVFSNRNSLTEEFAEEKVDVELSKAEGTSSSEEKQCGMHCGTSNKDDLTCLSPFSLSVRPFLFIYFY